jgi:hypothetical protein
MSNVPYSPSESTQSSGPSTGSSSGSYGPTSQSIAQDIADYNEQMNAYNQYVSQMFGGQQVNVDLLNPMAQQAVISNLESMGIRKPRMGGDLYNYLKWTETLAPGADSSVAAYLDWWKSNHSGASPAVPQPQPSGAGVYANAG